MNTSPPARRVLKRSASTASLPTPPRTYRRRARGRSRGSCDSDSDSDNARSIQSTDEEDERIPPVDEKQRARKKRRVTLVQDKDDEEAFWMGGSEAAAPSAKQGESSKSSTTARPKGPLLYRKLQASASSSQVEQGLLSPPASRRKPVNPPVAPTSPSPATTVSEPVTPQRKTKKVAAGSLSPIGPLVDSPSNPFIVTPDNGDKADSDSVATPGVDDDDEAEVAYDKPTVTYVFRGVRRSYQNPMYDHKKNRPLSPPPNSKLPVEDPLFSPDPTCKPRLLFPEAHKKRKSKKAAPLPRYAKSDDEEDSESDLGNPTFRIKAPKFGESKLTLDAELRKAKKAVAASDEDVFC